MKAWVHTVLGALLGGTVLGLSVGGVEVWWLSIHCVQVPLVGGWYCR